VLQIIPDEHGYEVDQERGFTVNGFGTRSAAVGAEEAGAKLVCLSADYLFDGGSEEPYNYLPPACSTLAMPILQKPASEPPHWSEAIKGVTPLVER
jgi:hypothetical protein